MWRSAEPLYTQITDSFDRDGLLDGRTQILWLRYTVEKTEWDGHADIQRLRTRFWKSIGKLRVKYPGLRAGWVLDWTPPYYPDGSRPHDNWIIVLPKTGVDALQMAKKLQRSVKRIAKQQNITLHDEGFCKPMKTPRGALAYIAGLKGKEELTLAPEPPKGTRPVSSGVRDLLAVGPDGTSVSLEEDVDDECWDVEVDGNRFLYLRKKRWKTDAEKREFAALNEEYQLAGGLSFIGLDVPVASIRRSIISAFRVDSIRKFSGRGSMRWVRCTSSTAVEKTARRMHIVKTSLGVTKMMPYGGDPVTAVPADHVLALNLNISTKDGERRAYELCDLLEQHAGRPVFRRVSGGKTNGFHHLHVFVVGLTPEVKQEWIDVVDEMRFQPGCQGFRVHLDEPIRMPLSPAYWRTPTLTEYGMSYRVNDFRVASFDFDYFGFAETARYYAEDLSRCEGAGMPPADLPRRARPDRSLKRPQGDRDGARAVYAIRRATLDEISVGRGTSTTRPSSGSDGVRDIEDELQRGWRVSTYRGMRAWFFCPSARRRRARLRERFPAGVPTARRSSSGS